MTAKGTREPTGFGSAWATRRGALVVSLACAIIALALSLPHAIALVCVATQAEDVHLLWPFWSLNGPGIEHVYLGLALVALLLAAPSLRSGSKSGAFHCVAIVSTCLALVPLAVAVARFFIALYILMLLTPP
jgi:hypothetical protein